MSTIISAPLNFPKIEPDNWDEWWNVWNTESKVVFKTSTTHNSLSSPWTGLDIYVKPGKEDLAVETYNFRNINRPDLFSNFFSNLENFPLDISVMRAASTIVSARPHNDFTKPMYSVRAIMHDANPSPTWYYLFDDKKVYLNMPADTNSWIYPDHESKHGSDFQFPYRKILLMFFGTLKPGYPKIAFDQSLQKYKDYVIFKE
jgi:hypothetical protein